MDTILRTFKLPRFVRDTRNGPQKPQVFDFVGTYTYCIELSPNEFSFLQCSVIYTLSA